MLGSFRELRNATAEEVTLFVSNNRQGLSITEADTQSMKTSALEVDNGEKSVKPRVDKEAQISISKVDSQKPAAQDQLEADLEQVMADELPDDGVKYLLQHIVSELKAQRAVMNSMLQDYRTDFRAVAHRLEFKCGKADISM